MLEELSGRAHHLADPAPARQGRARPPGRPARQRLETPHHRPGRPLPPPPAPRRQVTLKGVSDPVRQIAIKNIGRDQPTLLITNDHATPAKDLFARYAERMLIENELDAYISGFNLNALSSAVLAQRRPRHHPHRRRRQPLPAVRPQPAALLPRHPRHDLAALPRRHRNPAHRPRRRHRRPRPAQPPPRAHRRRLRRPPGPHPMVGRPDPPLPLPAPLTSTSDKTRQVRTSPRRPATQTSTEFLHRESRLTGITSPGAHVILGDVGTPLPSATPSPAPDHRNLRPYALLSLTFRAPDAPACMPGAVSSSPPSQ